jgi:hypothetical protein
MLGVHALALAAAGRILAAQGAAASATAGGGGGGDDDDGAARLALELVADLAGAAGPTGAALR